MSATETSLRVVVRARPMNTQEMKEGARRCVEFYENTGQACRQLVINDSVTFTYDLVFPDTSDQETVYEKTALPLLDKIFAGFNATILAYGQTGSGKTYTIGTEDNDGTDEMSCGIIPRLVQALFQRIMSTEAPEAFTVTVSMLEVYGHNVYDLLRRDKVKLDVHGDEKNCTIKNLTAVPVIDSREALRQLATGCHYRTKAVSVMNPMSSRSHAVFTVYVEKTATSGSDSAFSAKLQLVDLAGSERLAKTGAVGNRRKEGININSGLSVLSRVIDAIATKQKHIPYRDSVLTRVLQDSIGKNSYTVFLACISPADTNSQETLNTLRYADDAKKIESKPIVNKNPKAEEIAVLHAQIKRLQQEVSDLKQGIAPAEVKYADMANSAEMLSLKDEVSRQAEKLKERKMKQSECIVRVTDLVQRNTRLEAENDKLRNMINYVRTALLNEEMAALADLVKSIQQVIGDSEDSTTMQDEEQDETTTAMPTADETMYDAERLPELQAEIDDSDKQIAMKDENRQKVLDEQREFIEGIKQRESEKTQLVARCHELETEINKLCGECEEDKSNDSEIKVNSLREKHKAMEKMLIQTEKSVQESDRKTRQFSQEFYGFCNLVSVAISNLKKSKDINSEVLDVATASWQNFASGSDSSRHLADFFDLILFGMNRNQSEKFSKVYDLVLEMGTLHQRFTYDNLPGEKAEYNVGQFVPVKLGRFPMKTLITSYNDLGNGRFYDEVSKKSFKYDHVRKEASDLQPHPVEPGIIELWRQALQTQLDTYIDEHCAKSGIGVVFARNGTFTICIVSHMFQRKNFFHGRWQSEWHVPVRDETSGSKQMNGKIWTEYTYKENTNESKLQLTQKCSIGVKVSADFEKTATEILHAITMEEKKYQNDVQMNYDDWLARSRDGSQIDIHE